MPILNLRINRFIPANWLKRLGLAVAAIWVFVLVAAVGSMIFQKIDGPTIQSVTAANVSLEDQMLDMRNSFIDRLNASQNQINSLRSELDSKANELDSKNNAIDTLHTRVALAGHNRERLKQEIEMFLTFEPADVSLINLLLETRR